MINFCRKAERPLWHVFISFEIHGGFYKKEDDNIDYNYQIGYSRGLRARRCWQHFSTVKSMRYVRENNYNDCMVVLATELKKCLGSYVIKVL